MPHASRRTSSRKSRKGQSKIGNQQPVRFVMRHVSRGILLAGVSATALLLGAPAALAGSPLGYWSPGQAATSAVTAATQAGAQQAAAAAKQTQITVQRVTQSIAAMQATQAAARAAAMGAPSTVPNGLVPGGLQVAPGAAPNTPLWQGANLPTSFDDDGRTKVTVEQTQQQAILTWQSFNVGRETDLYFNQSAGGANANQWIALNRVLDPSASPSQILGTIKAEGQVYIINQNGIIFGGSSQINVGTLIASALPINDSLVKAGTLYSNLDAQFTFSAYSQPGGGVGPTDPFTPPAATAASQNSAVIVQAGAQISTPLSNSHNGGRVILIGPEVSNAGAISTPDGQTILAAGQQVALLPHDTNDPSLRGLDVYVGSIIAPQIGSSSVASSGASIVTTGNATNTGVIESDRGNITIAGGSVTQNGDLISTTSVSLNGRIDISSSTYSQVAFTDPTTQVTSQRLVPTGTGMTTLGLGSLTEILPELNSAETVVGTSLALPSQINITGNAVYIDGGIVAPSADVTVKAGSWNAASGVFVYNSGQIYLDKDALIDVSGSMGVQASVSQNIVAAQLQGAQLADSPLQRSSFLHGATIYIDINQSGTNPDGSIWIGTPLADVSGYVGLIQRTVGELTTSGGSVTLNAGGSVVLQQGSLLNVSGGYVQYQGATVNTSRLLGADGHLYDISKAPADITYVGVAGQFVVNHSHWGVSEVYTSPLLGGSSYQQGYIQGGAGGSISIQAPTAAIDGDLLGLTVNGERQRSVQSAPSSFSLAFLGNATPGNIQVSPPSTTQNIVFQTGVRQTAASFDANSLTLNSNGTIYLSPDIVSENGFGSLSVNSSNGTITVLAPITIKPGNGNGISLTAANIDVKADIESPGGAITLKVVNFSPDDAPSLTHTLVAADLLGRGLTLESGVTITTAGLVVDDRSIAPHGEVLPLVVNGGSITLSAFNLNLGAGSVIDVSGGIAVNGSGKQTNGNAGQLAITGGTDKSVNPSIVGQFAFGSILKGYGVGTSGRGGSLSLTAPLVQIGGTTLSPDVLLLDPSFFDRGGFANFAITGIGKGGLANPTAGVSVADGTHLAPQVSSYLMTPGNGGAIELSSTLLPTIFQSPVSLSLNASGFFDPVSTAKSDRGDVVTGVGTSISLMATSRGTGSVTVTGDTVALQGSIVAPGGAISIKGGTDTTGAISALVSVDLAAGSTLSTAGTWLPTQDNLGNVIGSVLNGGSVSVTGNILAESGALIDVSGASGSVQIISATQSGGSRFTPITVASDGGAIKLIGTQELFSAATLKGDAGGSTAKGGSLTISSQAFIASVIGLTVTEHLAPGVTYASGKAAIGSTIDNNRSAINHGYFDIDSFEKGHFDYLTLGGLLEFAGPDPISIEAGRGITLGTSGLVAVTGNASVTLSAPYVAIGVLSGAARSPSQGILSTVTLQNGNSTIETTLSPSAGAGSFTIKGSQLIDVGSVALQGVNSTTLISAGDVRGNGTFEASGAVAVTAGQIYPTTEGIFTIAAFDAAGIAGSVAFSRYSSDASSPQLPLSAGGVLNVFASTITQDGILRAPMGEINLGSTTPSVGVNSTGHSVQTFSTTNNVALGDGSITSVSAVDPVTGQALTLPYGTMLNGTNWIDPAGVDITNGGVPSKTINVAGAHVDIGNGATLDLSGGGDLYAYNWVKGTGGSSDILGASGSFAVIPSYLAPFAPVAQVTNGNGGVEAGWSNSNLSVGDRITLAASTNGLPAGTYTLLPARYALLPGAFLVTPVKGAQNGLQSISISQPDGSSIVSGSRFNGLDPSRGVSPLTTLYEIDSSTVVRSRAQYDDYLANSTLGASATANDAVVPRLPIDAGQLILNATATMRISGEAVLNAPQGGLGGIVSIASPSDIVVNDTGTSVSGTPDGTLYLSASGLTNFGAQSLLIGGFVNANGRVTVTTANLTLDNDAANPLTGPDITLISSANLTINAGAVLNAQGTLSGGTNSLLFGTANASGSGDGALIRVSVDPAAQISRDPTSVSIGGGVTSLVVGANATIQSTAGTAILDSTNAVAFDPSATLNAASLALGAGRISLQLDNAGSLQPSAGLVLPEAAVNGLQAAGSGLSLLSYSSVDIYGTGTIGSADLGGLSIHTAGIRGFNQGSGNVTFAAKNVTLDNSPGGQTVAAVDGVNSTPSGALVIAGDTIIVGANTLNIVGYADVNLNAPHGLLVQGTGGLNTAGNLTITAGQITGATGAKQNIAAGGALAVNVSADNPVIKVSGGLGASLTLMGSSVTDSAAVVLPSGSLTLHATTGDVTVEDGGILNVAGASVAFFDQTKYSGGGQVALTADAGSVHLQSGSTVDVSAPLAAGDAGSLSIGAAQGTFTFDGVMRGQSGAGGKGGSFYLDVGSLPTDSGGWQSLSALNTALNNSAGGGGFTRLRNIRVRNGDVLMDGTALAQTFNLAVDSGTINVTGTIDASGVTGGAIALYAYNGVTLANGSVLTVAAQQLDNAGKGGSVDLETGEAKSIGGVMTPGIGWIDIQMGSAIDLSVNGGPGGTLHLRAPQISGIDGSGNPILIPVNSVISGNDLAIKPLNGRILNPSSIVAEGYAIFDLTGSGGIIDINTENAVNANGQGFASSINTAAITNRLLGGTPNETLSSVLHIQPGEEIVSLASLPLTLNQQGSSIAIPAGAGVTFPTGTPTGDTVSFSVSGIVTAADGSVTHFAAGTQIAIASGSTVALDHSGSMNFASGTAPINISLKGSGSSATGAGSSTTIATTNGTSLNLNGTGSSLRLPVNTTITFTNGVTSGDSIQVSSGTVFSAPAAGGLITLAAPGATGASSTITLGANTVISVPPGDIVTSNGAFTTTANGSVVSLVAGNNISLASGAAINLSFPRGTTITNAISGVVIQTTISGSSVSLNRSVSSNIKVADNHTQISFPNGTPGSDSITTSVNATIINSDGTTAQLTAGVPTTLAAGSILTLTGSPSGGMVTFFSGSTPLQLGLLQGSYTLSNNTSITSLSAGSTLATGTAAGTLTLAAGSDPLSISLPAGRYVTNGQITGTPAGTTFSAGVFSLFSGLTSVAIALPAGTFTTGNGVTINSLAAGTTAKGSTATNVAFTAGSAPIALSLGAGTYDLGGGATFGLVGDLVLNSDWNLNGFRYGPGVTSVLGSGEPGILTLRTAGNLIFNGALSDGFGVSPIDPSTGQPALWEAPLLAPGSRSWSYRFTAGADFTGVDFHDVLPSSGNSGSVIVGKTGTETTSTSSQPTSMLLKTLYQVVRTGTGDIDISAGKDVQFLNQFATIYTAGSQIATSTSATISPGGSISALANTPITFPNGTPAGSTIVSTSDGTSTLPILLNGAARSIPLPANALITFVDGASATVVNSGVTTTASQVQLTTTAAGATVTLISSGSQKSITVPSATTVTVGSFNQVNVSGVVVSAPATVRDSTGTVVGTFAAGAQLTGLVVGDTITLTGGGTLTYVGTSIVAFTLPAGTFTTNGDSNSIIFGSLSPGSTMTLVGGGQISASTVTSLNVTVPVSANTTTTLLPGSTLTLTSNGAISSTSTSSIPVTLPLNIDNTLYAFDLPNTQDVAVSALGPSIGPAYTPQYSANGGNVTISAKEDIIHLTTGGADDSSLQLPTNWLYRRDNLVNGVYAPTKNGDRGSATWWIDYSNFFEGIGALGGGNVTLNAGRDVKNVDAVAPTNAWSPYQTNTVTSGGSLTNMSATSQPIFEFGGGDVVVSAGRNINGGVYYVERGLGILNAGGNITTNQTRSSVQVNTNGVLGPSSDPITWLPTTLFLGKGGFEIAAEGDILLGQVANPFLLPMGRNNGYWNRTFFTTYASTDSVDVSSLAGDVTIGGAANVTSERQSGTLASWIGSVLAFNPSTGGSFSTNRPWLRLVEAGGDIAIAFSSFTTLMPPTLNATALSGDVNVVGDITLMPSATGTLNLLAEGSINGLQPAYHDTRIALSVLLPTYQSAQINLSDADPSKVSSVLSPITDIDPATGAPAASMSSSGLLKLFTNMVALFAESGSPNSDGSTKQALHDSGFLHAGDREPVRVYAKTGNIADAELFAGKRTNVIAGHDITNVSLYLQNVSPEDTSIVSAGRDIILFDANNASRSSVTAAILAKSPSALSQLLPGALSGDISIGGPGTLEVLAGRNLDLGAGTQNSAGTGVGIVSIGNARNPYLPFDQGAQIIVAAGVGIPSGLGLSGSNANFAAFISDFLDPATGGDNATHFLPELGTLLGMNGASNQDIWNAFNGKSTEQKATYALDVFYLVLRDAGRDHNAGDKFGGYSIGMKAVADLFPGNKWTGNIIPQLREIQTTSGGDIDLLAPGGGLLFGQNLTNPNPLNQGIMTLSKGSISIFTDDDVTLGTSRIFTFRGGNEIIWSTHGNIAAGAASKTLQSAPPNRFLIDPETGASTLDVAGLATGGGIGVLQTVVGAPTGSVDLIAPNGFVDFGDAGVRVSGDFNVAAVQVLNASNLSVGGASTGVPTVQAPNVGGLTAASNTAGAASKTVDTLAPNNNNANQPSILIVEVEGYGGGSGNTDNNNRDSDEERRRKRP